MRRTQTDLEVAFSPRTCQGIKPALYGFIMWVVGLFTAPKRDNRVMDDQVIGVECVKK